MVIITQLAKKVSIAHLTMLQSLSIVAHGILQTFDTVFFAIVTTVGRVRYVTGDAEIPTPRCTGAIENRSEMI